MTGFKRETAQRIFAKELYNTKVICEKDAEDMYAPQYILTPTGAKINRVFIVGTLTEKEDIGTDTEYWRARISDPTGTFFAYIGTYQPDATRAIGELAPPCFVAVVGKIGTYINDREDVMTSVKPETITVVDAATRDIWVAETARLTIGRANSVIDGSCSYIDMMKENYPDGAEQYIAIAEAALSGEE